MTCVTDGLIVGGGIAGLAASIALARVGVHCDVVEIGHEPDGAGMSLTGGAVDALAELGIYDQCYRTGSPFTAEMSSPMMFDAAGEPLGASAPPQTARADGRAGIGVYRPEFARILRSAAQTAGVTVHTGLSVQAIQDQPGGALVTLTDGREHSYDFVIGADGAGSRTRSIVFPDAPEPAYAGQMSIRWMIPGVQLDGRGWYVSAPHGRLGFFAMPHQNLTYVPMVLNMPETRLSQSDAYSVVAGFLDSFSAPDVVALGQHLHPDSQLICRPFKWLSLPQPWYRGPTLLIGDAAHATTAHLGMGAGMALEDAIVLAQSIKGATSLTSAYETFMSRRYERVRTVVETSVALSKAEQPGTEPVDASLLRGAAAAVLSRPF